MSNTKRSFSSIPETEYATHREPWQAERGERYGNNRKAVAAEKRKDRKLERTKMKRDRFYDDI